MPGKEEGERRERETGREGDGEKRKSPSFDFLCL